MCAARDRTQLLVAFAYDGAPFRGVHPARGVPTAGEALLARFERALGERPRAFAVTARTDAGVHADLALATGWLADAPARRELAAAQRRRGDGLGDVVIRVVPAGVHARGIAAAKRYVYVLNEGAGDARSWGVEGALDVDAMREGARHLLGRRDRTALRGPGRTRASPVKTVHRLEITRVEGGVRVVVEGDAFVRKMVRNLVGLLVAVGRGEREPLDVHRLHVGRDPRAGEWPAPAHGLVLAGIHVDLRPWDGPRAWWTRPAHARGFGR